MKKLYQIKFIKETELKKIGDIANCSKKSADGYINAGYAEYVNNEIKQPEKRRSIKEMVISIIDLFDKSTLKEKSDGNFQTECPHCGLQGGRTQGFILFPKTNTAYCHSSQKSFRLLEVVALKNKLINCNEGREKGQKGLILTSDQFKETLDILQDTYTSDIYNEFLDLMHIRDRIELPGQGILMSEFANSLSDRFQTTNEIFYKEDMKRVVEIKKNIFEELKPNRFITLIERKFKPWNTLYKRNGDSFKINKSMNQSTASAVLVSPFFEDKMPIISRIFNCQIPIIHNGKLEFPKKGYDKQFNSWTSYESPTINENMPVSDAKKIFYNIYNEFCFQTNQDYVNAIAGLLTPYIRGLYNSFNVRSPFFMYLANRERAGKDYCQNITQIVNEGCAIDESPISTGEYKSSGTNDELRKKIVSAMMQGKKSMHFANNKGNINSAVLEGILTSKTYSDRLLGGNKIISLENEMDYSGSGNIGLTQSPDLTNRTIFTNLFLDIENPNSRFFKNPDLHGWVFMNRSLILSALYSLVKNWFDKGMPKGSIPFTSYPEWSEICGGIMENAGLGNPCVRSDSINGVEVDIETSEMKLFFEYMFENKPDTYLSSGEIKELIKNSNESFFGYFDWDNKSHQIKFGKKLNKNVDRIYSDIRLVVNDKKIRTTRWMYKFTMEKVSFDKKSIFEKNLDIKDGHVGYVGHLLPPVEITREISIYRSSENIPDIANMTINKSDREVQFYDTEECQNIKTECTKQEVLDWIKTNHKKTFEDLDMALGVGSIKFKNELKKEGMIDEIKGVLEIL